MIEFKLPSLGADMDEGTLLEWKVAVGDKVEKGQAVALVDTAKAAVDVEIWQPGVVHEILVQAGEQVPVGTVLATLLEEGEEAASAGQAPPPAHRQDISPALFEEVAGPAAGTESPAPPPPPAPDGRTAEERRHVTPAARRRARELGLDLESIAATGPGGALTLEDVERAGAQAAPQTQPARPAAPAPQEPPAHLPGEKYAAMRAAIAAAMARSKREIPHYYLSGTIPMAHALEWLARENEHRPMTARILPAALQLKAIAVALAGYPELNGWFQDGAHHPAERIHLGVAISLRQGGLVAPAILDADRKSLDEIMANLADLVQRTRTGTLRSSEMTQATVTATILGDQGVESVFGVIYPPQVALVGFGRTIERPWVQDGQVLAMPLATASLSADHRVSDGHRGGRFLAALADILQCPEDLALA